MNNLKEMFDILFLVFVTMVTKVTMGTIVHRVTIVPMISLVTLFFMVAIFTIVICMYSWYIQVSRGHFLSEGNFFISGELLELEKFKLKKSLEFDFLLVF